MNKFLYIFTISRLENILANFYCYTVENFKKLLFSALPIPYHLGTFLKIFHSSISKTFYHYFNLRKEIQKEYINEEKIYLPYFIVSCNFTFSLSNSNLNFYSFWEFSDYEKRKKSQ